MKEIVKVKNSKGEFVNTEIEPYGKSLSEKFIEEFGDKIIKDTLEELKRENRKLKIELKENERTLEHRDSVLSIMYDLVRSNQSDKFIVETIKAVIDFECCDKKLTRAEKELVLRFRRRDF